MWSPGPVTTGNARLEQPDASDRAATRVAAGVRTRRRPRPPRTVRAAIESASIDETPLPVASPLLRSSSFSRTSRPCPNEAIDTRAGAARSYRPGTGMSEHGYAPFLKRRARSRRALPVGKPFAYGNTLVTVQRRATYRCPAVGSVDARPGTTRALTGAPGASSEADRTRRERLGRPPDGVRRQVRVHTAPLARPPGWEPSTDEAERIRTPCWEAAASERSEHA
jgi:hypothetical protein